MKLHCIFLYDKYEKEWDVYDTWSSDNISGNPEGWEEKLDEARSEGSDVRTVIIAVPIAQIRKALKDPVVRGEVK